MSDAAVDELLARARAGRRGAVARLVSLVERDGPEAEAVARRVAERPPAAHVVGVTGPPGAGKSTLVGAMAGAWVAAGATPAVIAVDPSSPVTGGAILGDRVRMEVPEGAYVRSMATRGERGGLAAAVPGVVRLLDHLGFDPVVIETVGVGQSEIAITAAADTAVLVTAPGWGDAVQAAKAGLLEVADVLVVNKADRPDADLLRRELEQAARLGHVAGTDAGAGPPVVMAAAVEGRGVDAVLEAVAAHRRNLGADGLAARRERRIRAEVAARAERALAAALERALASAAGRERLGAVAAGALTPAASARAIAAEAAAALG